MGPIIVERALSVRLVQVPHNLNVICHEKHILDYVEIGLRITYCFIHWLIFGFSFYWNQWIIYVHLRIKCLFFVCVIVGGIYMFFIFDGFHYLSYEFSDGMSIIVFHWINLQFLCLFSITRIPFTWILWWNQSEWSRLFLLNWNR